MSEQTQDENSIIRHRREKLAQLRAQGQVFGNSFRRDAYAADLQRDCAELSKEELEAAPRRVAVVGRIMFRRVMGKASFISLQDVSGRIQAYLRAEAVGDDAYAQFNELWDLGDIVGITGTLFRTNKGELTVAADSAQMLTKAVRPLPEKFHGLSDQETRYRQRYLDLIMNESSRRTFAIRSATIAALREFFLARDFLEVETPMMQVIPGGATARPFVTHHNALDMDLYLRVAPELYLKRLVVGGFERVFEINRNFRNEGLSTKHNPEFTMLEFYQAYADFTALMDLTEQLLRHVCQQVLGSTSVQYQGHDIEFGEPIPRLTMTQAIADIGGLPLAEVEDAARLPTLLAAQHIKVEPGWGAGRMQMELFEALVEPKLIQPTFITAYPAEVSPLARRNDLNPDITDRFELFVAGRELANGFSELNDPEDQAQRFLAQVQQKDRGDHEAMHYDEDYVQALEYGMPPTAGEGIGVDRLVMLLADAPSIRDVLLFPHMRPKH